MDDHRYGGGGGGGMRRAPYNKGPQGRGASFGGRDVRGYQPQQSQGQGGYGSASGSGSGGYNGYNQGQNQQGAPRMLQQGHVQNQGPRPFKQYGQGQGYQNDEQQSQGQSNYQQVSGDNQYQQQQQQHQLHPPSQPYNRQQQLQQQPAPARYNSQGTHVDSTQYGHQVPYNNMTAGQSYVPPIVGGNVQQATYYDNYGNVYNTPGGGAGAPVDTVTTQMVHMSVTPGQGQSQGQNQVQTQHRVHQQNTERAADPMISYVPVVTAVATEGTVRTPPVQGYMATASMVPAPQYIQSMQQPNAPVTAPQYNQSMRQPNAPVTAPQYNQSMQQPNAPVPQVIYGNTVYSQAQGQGQEQQNQNYGGRGYSAGGSGGRGMGGRPLNVDARPFNSYQSGNNQNNNQGRDYYNNGYNQGHGHGQQMNFEQQGGNMGNQNVYSNENHAYSQQQHVYMPQSTANRMPAGNNGHNGHNAGRGESYPAAQGAISRGGDGEPLGIDGCNHVGVAENDNSNQLKTSDTSASS